MTDMDNAREREYYTELTNYTLEKLDSVLDEYPHIIGSYEARILRDLYNPRNLRIIATWSLKAEERLRDLEYQRIQFPEFQGEPWYLKYTPAWDLCWTRDDIDTAVESLKKQCELMEESMKQKITKP
ncbi:hypothetical protein QDX21_07195 [Auritidibacter ignavus]|uniref:Uncharacterized protein n=1 Tax=Auritidibacter ignavus TaxID=678932 RepID=A0AAJ6AF66_9MICC|nr:hypothetical protein [Auritidibacter ignavus]WGH92121.1 hypothetical protein QDX21_07195 [Auritidibacter ignavus]